MSNKQIEIVTILVDAVEYLKASVPGHGTAETRSSARQQANELMAKLPKGWHKLVDESWAAELGRWA